MPASGTIGLKMEILNITESVLLRDYIIVKTIDKACYNRKGLMLCIIVLLLGVGEWKVLKK